MPDTLFPTQSVFSSLLDGARGLQVVKVSDRTFVYVAAVFEDSISIYEVFSDGTVDAVGTVPDTAALALNGVSGFASVTLASGTFLYAGSEQDDSITVFQVASDGNLTLVQSVLDDATLELDLVFGKLSVAQVGGNRFLVAHGNSDDGLSVFQIAPNGTLAVTWNEDNASNSSTALDGAASVEIAQIGARTFVYAPAQNSRAVNVFELTSAGALVFVEAVVDDFVLGLNGAVGVEHTEIGGRNFVIAAGSFEGALTVFEAATDGTLTFVSVYRNASDVPLSGVYSLESFKIDGVTYLAAVSTSSDALTLFTVGGDGALTFVDAVLDSEDPGFALNDPRALVHVNVHGVDLVVVSGLADDGISVFRVLPDPLETQGTANSDVLIGTAFPDSIDAFDGNDVVVAGDGDDIIDAGRGDDVVSADAGNDTVNAGEGSDKVIGGDGDDLIDGDGDLSQTGSNVVSVAETGQDLALSVTLPDSADGSTIEISGLINRTPLVNTDFNIVYVIDVSGSMDDPFVGTETVGDLNGDGTANTLMDGTISAFQSLNGSIVNAGFTNADLSIVTFQSTANTV